MFWLEKLFKWKQKSFDNDIWDYALFDDIFNSKNWVAQLSRSDYLALYTGWVYVSISTISDEVAKLDKRLFWNEDRQDKVRTHEYTRLIKRQLLIDVVSYLLLNGSAFILKTKIGNRVDSLEVLRSDRITIIQTDDWIITWYRYFTWKKDIILDKDQVIPFHLFNPEQTYPNKTMWVSPVQAVAMQMSQDQAIINWNWSYFKNGASVGSVLETDKPMEEKNRNLLLKHFKSQFVWPKNNWKVAILDNNLKLKEIKPWQREMDFVEQRRFTRDEVLGIFKVPKAVIGLWEAVNVWNVKAFNEIFASKTVQPLALQIEEILNDNLFKGLGYFKFINVLPVDETAILLKYQSGLITKNEARLPMWYIAIDNWNIFVDWEVMEIKEEKSLLDTKLEKIITKSFLSSKKGTDEFLEKRWEAKIVRTDDYEKDFGKLMDRIWVAQEKSVIANVTKSFNSKAVEDIEEESDLWNEIIMLTLYTSLFNPFYRNLTWKEWQIAIDEVSDLTFESWNINKWIYKNILRFGKDIDKTTKKSILKLIKDWHNTWLSEDNIVKSIKVQFRSFRTARLKAIARTEVSDAVTQSRLEAWGQAGVKKKKWYTALDERVCPICAPMHWKVVALWTPYFKKWDTSPSGFKFDYKEINWPSAHTLCRCDIWAEIE